MTAEYLQHLPEAIPAGQVLVHNAVSPVACRPGTRGSRYGYSRHQTGWRCATAAGRLSWASTTANSGDKP